MNREVKSIIPKSFGKWENVAFVLSDELLDAIKNLLIAEIKLMRKVHKETPECWFCGAAYADDLSKADWLTLCFGGKGDLDDNRAIVYVEVPFEKGQIKRKRRTAMSAQ